MAVAGHDGAVHITVELVGVSVWLVIIGVGVRPPVSGVQTKGGGGATVGVGFTSVHEVTDKVTDPPGERFVGPAGDIPPGHAGGGTAFIPKFAVAFGPIVLARGLAEVNIYPTGTVDKLTE